MDRIYDQKEGYMPYVYYAIFSNSHISCMDTPSIPCANLEVIRYDHIQDAAQLQILKAGAIGSFLKQQSETVYEQVQDCKACIVIRGDIIKSETLTYLSEVLAFVNSYATNAIAILDLISIQWYDMTQWITLIKKDFYIHDHIQILVSQESGGVWLHTRGMMKYGRPDISILDIPKAQIHAMKLLVDQIIHYEALGAMVLQPAKFHTAQGACQIHPVFYNNFDNYDFNNAFIEMKYADIIKEA